MDDIFESSVRGSGDIARVFEFDGETSYFYLYCVGEDNGGNNILCAIKISSEEPDYEASDLEIMWSNDESFVGLALRGRMGAAFDCDNLQKFGGEGSGGSVPSEVLARLS